MQLRRRNRRRNRLPLAVLIAHHVSAAPHCGDHDSRPGLGQLAPKGATKTLMIVTECRSLVSP